MEELPAPTHSSPESDPKHPVEVATKLRKHGVFTHFPKDRNGDVCLRTNRTKASRRRRTGKAPPRAEKFGDLNTADHNVVNEGSESRDNHRYAVVVQDLAPQWIQSCPCETKYSHETEKCLLKFLEPSQASKVIYSDNSMEFGKACEILAWNHRTSTPHRSETNGISEGCVRRVIEGFSALSGLDERWSESMECYWYLQNVRDLLADGENAVWKTIWRTIQRANNSFGSNGWISSIFTKRSGLKFINLARKCYQESFLAMSWSQWEIWQGDILMADLEDLEEMDASDFYPRRINAKGSIDQTKRRWI